MAIPIAYNLRNLVVRKTTTVMTAFSIALTVAVLLAVLALVNGLESAFAGTGQPLNILVLRKGGTSELVSVMTRPVYQDIKAKPGIAQTSKGEPMASLEMVTVIDLPSPEHPNGTGSNITTRGLMQVGIAMREELKLVSGRWFSAGRREVVVGKSLTKRYPDAHVGGQVHFGKGAWDVVGIMDGGQSAVNSEIWGDLNQVAGDLDRIDGLSSVLLRATDSTTVNPLVNSLNDDQKLNVLAEKEQEYYAAQTSSGVPLRFMGVFISIIMAVGSSFAAMNTMYAAVGRRSKEIGTLRVLGFSRGSILLSFFLESVLLCVLGGILGCLLVLPLNNVTTAITSFNTFSEIAFNFHVSPEIMAIGIAFATVLGAIGGLLPARMAARKEILTALRET